MFAVVQGSSWCMTFVLQTSHRNQAAEEDGMERGARCWSQSEEERAEKKKQQRYVPAEQQRSTERKARSIKG